MSKQLISVPQTFTLQKNGDLDYFCSINMSDRCDTIDSEMQGRWFDKYKPT